MAMGGRMAMGMRLQEHVGMMLVVVVVVVPMIVVVVMGVSVVVIVPMLVVMIGTMVVRLRVAVAARVPRRLVVGVFAL